MKTVSIIIVNFNGADHTRTCIASLFRYHSREHLDVIVVDNHSSDGSVEILAKEFPDVRFIRMEENKGFGSANNAGVNLALCERLFFVNNDTIFIEETITALEKALRSDTKNGIVGPKLLNEDRTFQLSYGTFPTIVSEYRMKQSMSAPTKHDPYGNEAAPREVDWVTGAAFMMDKAVYEAVGGFDERYFLYFEDIDLNKKVRNTGYTILYIPSVQLIHLGGRSYGSMNPAIAYEYRRSQLHYYDSHNSTMQSILIRGYIALKYLPKLFAAERHHIMRILQLLMSRQ
jgi:GT2 family glycosyltransferase